MSRTTKQTYVYWIHLPEHTDIMTQGYIGVSHIGNIPGNAKSIQTPTGIFPSVSAAARAFAVSNQTMFNWANSESKIDFYIIASK